MDPELLEALRRDSGLRVDRDGHFFFHERSVENTRVQALFHRHLEVRHDGEVTLTVGSQWAYVACEAVASFVESMALEGGRLTARMRSGESVSASKPRLGFAPDGRCYVWLTPEAPPAVLLRSAHHALVEMLVERGEHLVLPLADGAVTVAGLESVPSPGAPWPGECVVDS